MKKYFFNLSANLFNLSKRFKNEQKPYKKSVTSPNKEGAVHNKSKKSNKEKEIDALKEMLQ